MPQLHVMDALLDRLNHKQMHESTNRLLLLNYATWIRFATPNKFNFGQHPKYGQLIDQLPVNDLSRYTGIAQLQPEALAQAEMKRRHKSVRLPCNNLNNN